MLQLSTRQQIYSLSVYLITHLSIFKNSSIPGLEPRISCRYQQLFYPLKLIELLKLNVGVAPTFPRLKTIKEANLSYRLWLVLIVRRPSALRLRRF